MKKMILFSALALSAPVTALAGWVGGCINGWCMYCYVPTNFCVECVDGSCGIVPR